MDVICQDRVVIVTGGARGLGRAHSLEFARQGAKVVVNDIGVQLDGTGGDGSAAAEVAEEIRALGGEAEVHGADVADWSQARELVEFAVERFGRLDVLVNNAGFVRDRMFVNLAEDEWDQVIRVHLKGHAATMRHAAQHWRDRTKAGESVQARIINTTSGAGLLGSVGQTNYASAKAGIIALTLNTAAELARYGVTVNAIAPSARTRMTETVFADMMAQPDQGFDEMAPENVSPLVAWLGSVESAEVTGRVFEVAGGDITVATGWTRGPSRDAGRRWNAGELGPVVSELLAKAPVPGPVYGT
ncbi:SDR family oxidoreductase [Saccharopolyspora mangrovi]|uniref:SDR family oxidoreductase n=1 Tax=Saccharopolyspora mangrovi TaxID=3082379 RepID=A0ABU6AGL8_9PSEU|nr:SDR family oxidoreductase [Saccharopolyspora sp. S2-29]MEB3370576.1 SDR family oxidoreductase [Saccharopolyspora sp. S2-29]MEB3371021.1 SDR family oxidoreductase [Saccharopolyspora sp. S2-29]